jgi:multisubunit Na+/H+ antiporter MnhB subunit
MMTAFDILLAVALLWSAWRTLAMPNPIHAVMMFIVFGLLMTLAWARLSAPDIALAEAAIGAGLTGALLLDAVAALEKRRASAVFRLSLTRSLWLRSGVLLLALATLAAMGHAMLHLPESAFDLTALVTANLANSGVEHPVTAVLLNFRGYDTLLEIAVLLIALLGVLAAVKPETRATAAASDPVLQSLARVAVPLMILVAGYLLWAGAHRPGGAFQAGAVLAAAAVLLNLAGLLPAWRQPGAVLRLGLAGGFLIFLAVAALANRDRLLQYPVEHAGILILLIESGLTVSIGLILAGLFLVLARMSGKP